jgi:Tol biopolymer transport system component
METRRHFALLAIAVCLLPTSSPAQPRYTIAVNTFSPIDTDVFVADADGRNARPLFADPALDYNASLSADGEWVIFTSERSGSADIYRGRVDGSELTTLVDDAGFDDQGTLSPDGRSLAFVSSRGGQADIWILDLTTRATRPVAAAPSGEFRPRWSPDGRWIAFSSDRDSPRSSCYGGTVPGGPGPFVTPQYTGLFIVRPDGSELRRITEGNEVAASPTWSSDGSRLIYHTAAPDQVCSGGLMFANGTSQIAAVELESAARSVLTDGSGLKVFPGVVSSTTTAYVTATGLRVAGRDGEVAGEFGRPSWSAAGQKMVFHRETRRSAALHGARGVSLDPRFALSFYSDPASFSPDGKRVALLGINFVGPVRNGRLTVGAPDGSGTTAIYDGPTSDNMTGIAWSPRGDAIMFGLGGYFQTAETRTARLMTIRPDGGEPAAITDGSTNDGMASWSPDGGEIVFRVASPGARGLYILDVATGARRKLATGSDYDTFPSWSPKGDWITFTSFRDGDYEIYRIRPDGTGVQRLTTIPGNDAHSSVSPDGQWIAFTTAKQGFKDEALALVLGVLPPPFQPYGEIAVMRIDGSEQRLLTDNSIEDGWPVWVPRRD